MEDIPEDYPQAVKLRAALANFDLNLFLKDDEDSLEGKYWPWLSNVCCRTQEPD